MNLTFRFDKTVANIPDDIKPKDQAILIHYLNSFEGWLGYHLKDKNSTDLKTTQLNAKIAELNGAWGNKISLIIIPLPLLDLISELEKPRNMWLNLFPLRCTPGGRERSRNLSKLLGVALGASKESGAAT